MGVLVASVSAIAMAIVLPTSAQALRADTHSSASATGTTEECSVNERAQAGRTAARDRSPGLARQPEREPTGWSKQVQRCLDDHGVVECPAEGYVLTATRLTWAAARANPPAGTALLEVTSAEESACVVEFLKVAELPAEFEADYEGLWFGLWEPASDGAWTLPSTSALVWTELRETEQIDGLLADGAFANWASFEPSNGEGADAEGPVFEDCAELYADGTWNDQFCSAPRFAIYESVAAAPAATGLAATSSAERSPSAPM